ncbi:hypothetical protein ABE10_02570, partial [Bacillus toyonensis]|nr:hypothetical protein [Bacillus toyonensis]
LQEHAGLGPIRRLPIDLARLLHLCEVVLETRPHLGRGRSGELSGQVRVRGHDEEGRTVQGVRTGGEHRHHAFATFDHEVHVGTDRASDPVPLHLQHLVRPEALELVQVVEQAIGIVRDPEVPLREVLLHDLGPAALAPAVDDLLVREHRLVVRAPVHRALLAVGQPPLVQLQEQPLVPAVVLLVRGVQLTAPVKGDPVGLEPFLLLSDVLVGPFAGVGATADRGVLGRQAEGVPSHRVEHVVPTVSPEARDDVGVEIVLRMPHVQITRRIGEHRQHVLAGTGVLGSPGLEGRVLRPVPLPLRLE